MVSFPDTHTFHDLVQTLVDAASDASVRQKLGPLLARLDEVAIASLDEPGARALARTRLSEALLVALGTDAAHKSLSRAVDDSDRIDDDAGRANSLVEAAHGAAALGSLGADLLARIEGHAAALEPSRARARLFATLSVAYGRAKESAKAAKMAVRAMNSAEKVEDPASRVFALCQVATVLHGAHASRMDAADAIERARAVALDVADEASRARATVEVAATLGRLDRAADGLSLLQSALGLAEPREPAAAPRPVATQEIDVVEAIEPLADVGELTEEAEETEPIPAARSESSRESQESVVENVGVPEGYNDPTAGLKFPSHSSRRRRR